MTTKKTAKKTAKRAPKKAARPKESTAPAGLGRAGAPAPQDAPPDATGGGRRQGRPLTLPGLLGALAGALEGLDALSAAFDPIIPTRSIRDWARNTYLPNGFDASRVRDLCEIHGISPILFHHPTKRNAYISSTPEGWQTWSLGGRGWFDRRIYRGPVTGLRQVSSLELRGARLHGWPW